MGRRRGALGHGQPKGEWGPVTEGTRGTQRVVPQGKLASREERPYRRLSEAREGRLSGETRRGSERRRRVWRRGGAWGRVAHSLGTPGPHEAKR